MKLEEQVKQIKNYPKYFIRNDGIVLSFKYGYKKELKQSEHKGYRRVTLSKNNQRKMFPVHRLVAQSFIINSQNKPFINHKDGNKRNNHENNLEWVTREENWKHNKEVLGYSAKGKRNNNYGYRRVKLYPSEELRSRLVELGIPRYRHNLAELGEMLPYAVKDKIEERQYFMMRKCRLDWIAQYWDYDKTILYQCSADTEANARAKMLIYLKEKGLLK